MIDSEEKRRKALALFELDDVWGIGRRTYEKLLSLGVRAPLEFADRPEWWVRRYFTKPGFQTWCELNGHPCINTEEVLQRQTICTSHCLKTVRLAVEDGEADHWKSKSEHRSPNYLTDINEILTVKC